MIEANEDFVIHPERKRLFCALDIITTGSNAQEDDVICLRGVIADFTCLPVKSCPPFFSWVSPKRSHKVFSKTRFVIPKLSKISKVKATSHLEVFENTINPYQCTEEDLEQCLDLGHYSEDVKTSFHSWVNNSLGHTLKQEGERQCNDLALIPIVYNWGFMSSFLQAFFGWSTPEKPAAMDFFDFGSVRDLSVLVPFVHELFFAQELAVSNRRRTAMTNYRVHPIVSAVGNPDKNMTHVSLEKLLLLAGKRALSPTLHKLNPYRNCFELLEAYKLISSRLMLFADIGEVNERFFN